MPADNQEFLRRLLATFKVEAQEHVSGIFSGLVELERAPAEERARIVETIFRDAHSLKGAARAVNVAEIESICQKIETIFAGFKRNEIEVSPSLLDVLHKAIDLIRHFLAALDKPRTTEDSARVREIGQQLEDLPRSIAPRPTPTPQPVTPRVEAAETMAEEPRLPERVRISTAQLDSLLLQTEELLSAKLAVGQHADTIRHLRSSVVQWRQRWGNIQRDFRTLQNRLSQTLEQDARRRNDPGVRRFLEFLLWNENFITMLERDFAALETPFERDRRALAAMVDNLLEDMKKAVMLPFSSSQDLLAKVARDLSREQGKEVQFVMEGGEVEVDRRILEEMKDPLVHLVRNCIDHGIEIPSEREQRGKPRRGTVSVSIHRSNSSKIELRIADDGAGIDPQKLKTTAVQAGIISSDQAEALNDEELLSLVYRSGLSTSPILTNVSGRGLGLAIVQEKVEKLGGSVSLQTAIGLGTTFEMVLPVTLSTFRGIIICVAEQLFVMPTAHIETVVRVSSEEIRTVANQQTISRHGETISLVRLEQVLGLAKPNRSASSEEMLIATILHFTGQRIAFVVDEIRQEQEVLFKSLGKQLVRVRNLAGATILGTGTVVPVLNVPDLMKSAVRRPARAVAPAMEEKALAKKLILVVDDSITSRTLLRNILEANGYSVETAVDGFDGFTKLPTGQFSLVVSDVEMPRMSGFDMTARIRGEKRFADLPVILVTALESQEDRERGIDVGANAYIVKSSFDQSDLLEAIRRLT